MVSEYPQWAWETELNEAVLLHSEMTRQNVFLSSDKLKVFKVDRQRWFSQELNIHRELSEKANRIVPQLYHHFKMKTDIVYVMEKMDGNMCQWKTKYNNIFFKKVVEKLIHLLEQLHNFGVVHNDTGLNNFLYKGEDKFYLTDFGISIKWNEKKHNLASWNIHKALDYYLLYDHLMCSSKSCLPNIKTCFVPVWKKIKDDWYFSNDVPTLFEIEKFPINYGGRFASSIGFDIKAIKKIEELIVSSPEQ